MPHKGSLQFWQHRRARRRLPRLRSAPIYIKQPAVTNLVAYKVGMGHVAMTDDSESPSKGQEISRPCTFVEVPETHIYGARFYSKNEVSNYKQSSTETYSKEATDKFKLKVKHTHTIESMKDKLSGFSDMTLLLVSDVKATQTGQHHRVRYESSLGGANLEEKYKFAVSSMGKPVNASEIFKNGEYLDVVSVTKGKGWSGPIKRFGTARQFHKATQKIRHVSPLGAFTPGKVMFTVPQAGQLGFNYRTEYNKRILKMGKKEEAASYTPIAGFQNYGKMTNDFIMLDGSIPGPAKRLVRLRKSVTNRNSKAIKEPKVNYMSTVHNK
ncbi:MAG: 50S ribosomal protein L3 [Candidatus Micrarchaeota archaeon]|nr:50S ribosomal protein L3 [Candidatus Micrarchaeota archaeon]